MPSKLGNLRELVGETVVAVVVSERGTAEPRSRSFIIFSDNTHIEVYINDGGVSKRWNGGVDEVLEGLARDTQNRATRVWTQDDP